MYNKSHLCYTNITFFFYTNTSNVSQENSIVESFIATNQKSAG